MTMLCDYLCLDISNLLYRSFYANSSEDESTISGMSMHMALTTLNKYYKQYKPKKVVMAFDRSSWRKSYTAEFPYLKPYKGNRRKDMTPSQQIKYGQFIQHLREFEELIINHTTVITLVNDHLEADDLLAGFIQKNTSANIVLISADSDLAQLMKFKNVTLISPITDKVQTTLAKFDNDAEYYLFHKCIRGDSTDNIQSAYPMVRSTRIKEVYDNAMTGDGYKFINFMTDTWTNQDKQQFTVKQMFAHNQVLIDLEKQPEHIRKLMDDTILEAEHTKKKFSYFHILQFTGKFELVKIKDSIELFIPMLSL